MTRTAARDGRLQEAARAAKAKAARVPEDMGDGTHRIQLTRGKYALIDSADLPLVAGVNWLARPAAHGKHWYAGRTHRLPNGQGINMHLHRVIVEAPDDMFVDHINGDGLDNRRCNLRLANRSENMRNRRHQKSATGVRGVYASGRKYIASICVNRRQISLGTFATVEEAKAVRDAAARELHGEFARFE